MRILQITSAKNFGGGERHFRDLAHGLMQRGHEVFVAIRPTNQWQDRLDFIPKENILFVSIRNSFGMFSAKRIARFIQRNNIDILHAHAARDYIAASVAARVAKNTKLVITRHVLFPLKPFHKIALKNVDRAIGVSPAVAVELANIFPRNKIATIENGLDVTLPENFAEAGHEFRAFHKIPVDARLVLAIGELKPLKGQIDLVLAAAEVVKKVPSAHFCIAGVDNSGGRRFRRELRRLASTLGVADHFTWLDWIEDTRPAFSAADLFVSPSHSESFGLAMLEAMASERAVIATRTEGAKTLIDDTRLLVPINEPVAMATAIAELLANEDLRAKTARTLRERAKREFSLEKFIDGHEKLYAELLEGSS
ncbi:MAG: glycosyltransferase [Acidobacteria bacterium OLB17]|nr:MAG: glycosyltransferase [Acidobacteria bacterium OLB17]MCZ2390379.1 glycosyltransferase family 4 protein [Acidobacteriota bacterium]